MPIYLYQCKECGDEQEYLLKMSEMENPLSQSCPNCGAKTVTQKLTTANFGDPIKMGVKRPDSGWGDVLKKMKTAHPNANLNPKFSPISGR